MTPNVTLLLPFSLPFSLLFLLPRLMIVTALPAVKAPPLAEVFVHRSIPDSTARKILYTILLKKVFMFFRPIMAFNIWYYFCNCPATLQQVFENVR